MPLILDEAGNKCQIKEFEYTVVDGDELVMDWLNMAWPALVGALCCLF